LTDFKITDNLSYTLKEGDCLAEKKDFLEEIAELRKELRKDRKHFHKYWPPCLKKLLEYGAENFPEEKFRELIEEMRVGMAEARGKTIEAWNKGNAMILSLINKQFQGPFEIKKIEKRVLALIGLMEDAFLSITEQMEIIDLTEIELERFAKKIAL